MALVLEAHGDAVSVEAPQFLAQRVVEFAVPFAAQEFHDPGPSRNELITVAPDRVLRVGECDALGIAGVPPVLRGLHLLARGLLGEGRERRGRAPRGSPGGERAFPA